MKILYVTTIGATMGFFKNIIRELIDEGNTVDIATNESDSKVPDCYREWGCEIFQISCTRSPFNKGTLFAIKEIRDIASRGKYDIVHCHTPIASLCTRIACQPLRKQGLKVIYTAHGFHFYKNAPYINGLVYYPAEWICSFLTDVLITINKEDYSRAKKHMHAKKVEYVPGVGIDVDFFKNTSVDRNKKREEIGVPKDAFLVLSVGELNTNKNHELVIREIAKRGDSNIHYAIAGQGELKDYLIGLSKELGVENQIHLLGYRNDCNELYKICDLYVLPSLREGLNVSLMEAKASGCKLKASEIRGNTDILLEKDINTFSEKLVNVSIKKIYMD